MGRGGGGMGKLTQMKESLARLHIAPYLGAYRPMLYVVCSFHRRIPGIDKEIGLVSVLHRPP